MVDCYGVIKVIFVSYGTDYSGEFGLQAQIRNVFNLQNLPVLKVRWSPKAVLENRWPTALTLDNQNVEAILRLVALRCSQDMIVAIRRPVGLLGDCALGRT